MKGDMKLSALVDSTTKCQNYGQVSLSSPDSSKCYLIMVGKSAGILQTFDFNNQPCNLSLNSITCEVVSEKTDIITRGRIEKQNNQFMIYMPIKEKCHPHFPTSYDVFLINGLPKISFVISDTTEKVLLYSLL